VLTPIESAKFKRDLKRVVKRGKAIGRLKLIVQTLLEEKPLPPRHRNHLLVGNWKGFYECHIEPDWLLIYQIDDENKTLSLARTGTHADLFDE
jgi:mRNA interferase YafQ